MSISYRVDDRTVQAYDGPDCVGRIAVPEIDFHWCDGLHVIMAGIGGVQTEKAYRGRGIASRMMEETRRFAITEGSVCSGISTNLGNVARRLYTRAGYTPLFEPGRFEKELHPGPEPDAPGVTIRPYADGDEEELSRTVSKPGSRSPKTGLRYRANSCSIPGRTPSTGQISA